MKQFFLALSILCTCPLLSVNAQKWRYDFIVPDNGNFTQAINAANHRANKAKRYRIFVRASNYRIGNTRAVLTAPNTSIIGEQRHGTQIEACPQTEGLDNTGTLCIQGADSTYIQDIEFWSNFRDDSRLYANSSVALSEKNSHGTVLKNISLLSTGNTYYNTDGSTSYLEDCHIAGTVDFVCGAGTAFFNHCDLLLIPRGDASKQHIIAAPTTDERANYGFIFSDCYINGPQHQKGRYLLGHAGRNHSSGLRSKPRVSFINCQMNIAPSPQGWDDNGEAGGSLTEYENTDSLFQPFDRSQRKTVMLSPEEAEKLTPTQIFQGWNPRNKSEQLPPPVLTMQGRNITWQDVPGAGCYAVCKDRKVVAFTTEPRYAIPAGTKEGACFTVRCANQMGGLGQRSQEVVYPQ